VRILTFGLALLIGLAALTPAPEMQPVDYHTSLIRSTAHAGRFVALTIDDGPDPAWTPRILDLLGEHGVQATFCVVGWRVRSYPKLVERIHDEGHLLCDHTVNHDLYLRRRDPDTIEAEIRGGLAAIRAVVPDSDVRWFRAPGGNWSQLLVDIAARAGMKSLGWTVDPRDWERPGSGVIVQRVFSQLRPGGIILLHDAGGSTGALPGSGDRSQTVQALRVLLDELPRRGYRFDAPA
jgi:peptidoglycan/xylan/chitin deacetylase (PgdA/CDA1 family)